MVETAGIQHDRIHLRLDSRSKRKLECVVAYEETTVSRFVMAVERVIEAHERTVLSAAIRDAFHDALLHPPESSAVLRRAVACYRERIGG